MNKIVVIDMLVEMKYYGSCDCSIYLEVYTVDGHFVTKKWYTTPNEAIDFIEENVTDKHKLTLTIR